MSKLLDDFLNKITMYRLVLYVLIFIVLVAEVFSFFGVLPFNPVSLALSTLFLIIVCCLTKTIFARVFKAITNSESVYITAFILSLIITPIQTPKDLIFLGYVGSLAMASKYILAINKKHLFNPAASAVFLSSLIFKFGASWWVGNPYMLIPILIGGLLVIRKLQRFSLVLTFFIFFIIFAHPSFNLILESPIFFFAAILLTEPQTTPPTKKLQIFYGGLVGLISVYLSLETALVLGNIFSYIVSPKVKLFLKLRQKIKIAPDVYDFAFGLDKKITFLPGQYMEWTLGHEQSSRFALKIPDSRGNRRYFTIASSPTEEDLRLGIKFYPNSSSFKKTLISMQEGEEIIASQISGEFTLPKDINKKLCFIAGGIGITPFRSIIKYLLDTNQKRDIVLFYANKTDLDVVYKDIFDTASKELAIKTIYVVGFITEQMIKKEVTDYKDRIFYISGPHSMVDSFEKTLKEIGLHGSQIKIDFFPGYA